MQRHQLPRLIFDAFPYVDRNTPTQGPALLGGSLASERLIEAYRKGYFPWFEDDSLPIMWYSPDPRTILDPRAIHISRRFRRKLNQSPFEISFDTAFKEVIEGCAKPRIHTSETWITPNMILAYCELHKIGLAHSVEVFEDQSLVGGLYGVSLGKHFYGESMFSIVTDASKAALVAMCKTLVLWEFELIDCQMSTDHLRSMGAVEIARSQFVSLLARNEQEETRAGSWTESLNERTKHHCSEFL